MSISGGTAETDLVALSLYYSNLDGADARLFNWSDIKPNIQALRPVEVDVTNSGTAGTWVDTLITTTESPLKANHYYAVLGYICDVNSAVVGVKGAETANLRICGPGTTASDDTSDFFIRWSEREGTPHIPRLNATNAGSYYVSTADNTASSTVKVQLQLADLGAIS